MCLQEIDIINDVVHYKSAYYGTVMVGSPPWPLSLPLCHHFKSDRTVHCSDVNFILGNLEQLWCEHLEQLWCEILNYINLFCFVVPFAWGQSPSQLSLTQGVGISYFRARAPHATMSAKQTADKYELFWLFWTFSMAFVAFVAFALPGTAIQRRAKCTEGGMPGVRSSLDSPWFLNLLAKASRSSILPFLCLRYKRSASGRAKDIDWDGRLARSLACLEQVSIPWCVLDISWKRWHFLLGLPTSANCFG